MDKFEDQSSPLVRGDLIVIESWGRLVSIPNSQNPQWFVVLKDQHDGDRLTIKPFNNPTSLHKAVKVKVL